MINILVTNDDGIDALGLTRLVEALSGIADVYVAAPKEEQSGKSMSITFLREVEAEERVMKGAVEAYAVDGAPADCVKWGLGMLAESGITPDFVISGINMGYNLGSAIHYSGTFSAAKEGALWGVRSIALSIGAHKATRFDYLLGLLPRLLEMSRALDPSVILNVNAPDIPSWDVKGVKAVDAAPSRYSEKYIFSKTESGRYQMVPGGRDDDGFMRCDFDWTAKGYVTVSPVPAEQTSPASLMILSGHTLQTDCLTVVIDPQQAPAAENTGKSGMTSKERYGKGGKTDPEASGRSGKTDPEASGKGGKADPKGSGKGAKKVKKFRRNTEKLVHAVSRMGKPVLITESGGKGDVFAELSAYAECSETVRHIHPDAWTAPDMEKYVAAADCRKILIAGSLLNVELLQTVPGFIERGYEVVVLEDCCLASDKLSGRLAIGMLKEYGCRISTLETEVMKMAGACARPVMESVKSILQK